MGKNIQDEAARYGYSLNYLVLIAILSGICVLMLYCYMDKRVVTDPELVPEINTAKKKSKPKLSMMDSIKFIFHSKYLGLIAILVISYGITINLVEVAWKNQIHIAFPNKNDFNAYMGTVSFYSGLATFAVILIGGYFVRLLGWRAGALATPVILGLTGIGFFYFMIFSDAVGPLAATLGTTSILLTVTLGTIQNILSKSTKYALFDPTKEMTYIPLDEESKAKGKAAVDVVGSRFGKAGGALMQQAMFIFIGPIATIAPYAALILLGFIIVWIIAVFKLYRLFLDRGGN
jgi:AAA family ATP:ADP antiporter